jgi:hypothetical protein
MTDQKVPTRPGSRWATGRRTQQEPFRERPGFHQGALVNPQAAARARLQTQKPRRSSSRRRTATSGRAE